MQIPNWLLFLDPWILYTCQIAGAFALGMWLISLLEKDNDR